MARMTASEWKKKKEEEKGQVASATSATPSTTSSDTTKRMTPGEWKAKKATTSVDWWAKASISLLNETQSYFDTWRSKDSRDEGEYKSLAERRSSLLAQADSWRKQYADNAEAISYIDSVVSALSDSSSYATKKFDTYSKFDSEDAYQKAVRESGYYQEYGNLSYGEIKDKLSIMPTGTEEYDWLSAYAPTTMKVEDYDAEISSAEATIETMSADFDDWFKQVTALSTGRNYLTAEEIAEKEAQVKAYESKYGFTMDSLQDGKSRLEEVKAQKWKLENDKKYNPLTKNEDFAKVSAQVAEDPTRGWGIEAFGKWYGQGDEIYDYINDIDGTRKKIRESGDKNDGDAAIYNYSLMNEDEIAKYNYLYNTSGKKAANEYLAYLENDLKGRRQEEVAASNAAFATEHPHLADAYSVATNLVSGIGLLDIAGQNAVKGVKEAVTGEYAGPINYNSAAMTPNTITTSIRQTRAQNIANKYGVIEINEEEHPIWSKVLNGKSFGDVYQLGMSMADSAAIALLSPVLGSSGTVLLGGSAGTQGVMDALANGATDEQALAMGVLNGFFEMFCEKYSLESLLKGGKTFIGKALNQALAEGSEEFFTSLGNNVSEILIMAEKSGYMQNVAAYIEAGYSESKAMGKALIDMGVEMGWDFAGGLISGGIMGGASQPIMNRVNANEQAAATYGADPGSLVSESLEINPDNKFAQRMQVRLDKGKDLSGGQLNRLVNQNEKALVKQDIQTIQSAAAERLTELGETGDVEAISNALAKQAAGKKLSGAEKQAISGSKYGSRVANELNTENIKSGEYTSSWAENIGTERINVEEYSRLVEVAMQPQETAETPGSKVVADTPKVAQAVQAEPVEAPAATIPANVQQVNQPQATGKESLQVAEESTAAEKNTVTLEKASEKYGAQAQAMIHTYTAGQDVAKFDNAYQVAYDMGKSGVSFDYVKGSQSVSYLTDIQKELAYEAGKAASDTEAKDLHTKNKAAANGKTGRKKGVVKGEGVTITDLKKTFNDTQGKAYKYLSAVAEATGVDIVLYRSQPNADGKFVDAQGRYRRSEPGTIYIDLNAGLSDIKSADDLAKYAMLRTFSHEFTHFIEKWNPIQYNEFRKVVFDTLTQRGENVQDLIEEKQAQNPGMSYDEASREVVAEAMTDILPDANFVQELAENHKTIFQKLLDQLKEFVDNLREYFNRLGMNPSREANALKEQVGETVKYLDSIVDMFDRIAVDAVENYQLTVAVDAATGETSIVEAKVETTVEETAPEVEESTPAVEETQEIPFDKRTLSLLKSAGRVGTVDLDGQKYVTNGSVMIPTTSAGVKYAQVELKAVTMGADVVKKTFENATTLVKEAPMEGKAGRDTVYIFDINGKKLYFNKKLFSHIDGGLLYAGQYNGGGIIKSVNEDGSINGYLLGMKFKDESGITDQKPSKLKSFSKKMQALIDAQTKPAAKPVESVIEHRTPDGVGEWSDIYERLKNPLHGMNKFVTGGFVFEVRLTPGVGYVGSIKRNSDEYVSNARELDYTSGMFANRNDAIQDIVDVARNNRLLEPVSPVTETKPVGTVTKAPDTVTETPKSVPKQAESVTQTASEKLATKLLEGYLTVENINSGGKALTSKELYALADEAFGGTQAEGAYNRKDAYDAMELAVNKFLLNYAAIQSRFTNLNGSAAHAVSGVKRLEHLLDLLPTQNVRTQEMEDFQQFSTPPNIAYLAAWSANINNKDMVLEPSAGIGGLAVFAKAWGAEVAVNELSKRRLEVLRAMGFDHLFNENAEQIDNILPDSISPSVVIMNPPFSSTAGRTANNKTSNAEKHIDQALARLRDGGRLVAVLGKSMNDQDYYRYWDKLRKNFNIRANLSIDGSNYKKYGTTWGVQIVVIDKTGPQTGTTVTGRFTDLTEVPKVLEGIRNDRIYLEENRPAGSNDGIRESVSDGANQQSAVGNTGSDQRTDGSAARTERKENRKSTEGNEGAGNRADGKTAAETGSEKTERQDRGTDRVAGRTDLGDGNGTAEPSAVDRHQPEQPLSQLTEQDNVSDDGVYATFISPDIPVKGGKKHPAVLVESAAMAAVSMPKATYKPSLPADVVKNKLSDAQLVTVTYAGQAHEQKLPDGRRKGFFVGDGTGVGKGRQIAGIILDNFMQGRTKAVWISKNNDLYGDAIRDWTATTGRGKDEVINHSRIKPKDKISLQEGILYSTYDTIKSEKGGNRLDQIVDWLGADFDGVIAFDEAHNMGNLFGKKGKFGKSKGSEKARAGVELQRRLPNARIVYVSATAATEVDNLAYAERIGLWGQGTAFTTAQDFISKIGASGLAAMELVIRDMKAMGTYVARSISYNGVNYDTVEHALDPMQTEIYNTMSRAWQKTMSNVQSALETTGGQYNSNARQKALGNFYSAMQRFYNQVLTSMSMPSVVADMRRELAAGHSCVLQIVNTNEAQQNKQLAEAKASGESLDNLDLTPREALLGYLTTSFPTQMFEEYTDDDGNLRSRPVLDSAGNPVQNKEAIRQRDALIEEVNQMSIPDGPLEMLFDAFGPDAVAENTGRSRRVVPRKQADGTISRVEERRTLNHRTADVQAFQDGKKRILVFSDAGGTGKSYHADRTEKNQQLRIHYVLQPGWVASNAVQGFGRTHRSNEASAPIYKLVTTNIKGQKRFTSTIARRLDQLGALTKGQRDTGSGMFGAKDNLETDLAKDSLREFYKRLGKNQIEGIDGMKILDRLGLKQKFTDEYGAFKLNDNLARDIGTFLNRILALEVDEQNVVFDAFISIYEMELEAAIQSGTLDTGMENVKADRIEVVDDKVIRQDKNTGASTHYIQAKTFTKPKVVTTVAEMEQRRSGFEGIYKTETGAIKAVYRIADKTTEWGAIQKQYRLVGPNQGAKNSVWGETTLKEKAQLVDKADWQKEWDAEVAKVPEFNEDTLHMLTGALLPIWNSLPQEGNTKVKRLLAHDGSTYLGRVIDKDLIDGVLKGFDIGRTMEVFTAKQVMDKALDNGTRFYLTNDRVQIFRSRVSGEWRLEVAQPYNSWYLTRRYPGIMQERISFRDRYFIPVGEKGVSILEKLLADNPVRNTADDSEQFQSRDYLNEDPYDTAGVHWGIEAGVMTNAEARKVWEAIANIGKRGYYYPGTVSGEYIVSADNALFFVKADYRYPSVNKIVRFNEEYKVNVGYAKELIIDARGNPSRHREALRNVADLYGEGFAIEYDRTVYAADARETRRGEGKNRGTSDSGIGEQEQQRTNTLTDREVLALAASQVKVSDMTDVEKDALDIFQKRLSKLEALQDERAEQGRLYKEQQFGAKVDRAAAAETLNRMRVLDGQIQKASAEVLTVEEKTVLKRVLQKARTVVEQQERQNGQEILKRWRDRRNNADAIKKYRDRLRGDVDELTNWVLHPDNKNVVKHIPDALKNTVLPFLSSINFMSKRSLAGGNHTQADKALMEQTRRLAKVMENTVDIDEMYSNYTDLPPDFMKNLRSFMDTAQAIVDSNSGDFIINQMTAEELQKLSKVVRTLKKYIMQMNRFHVNSMFRHVYEAGENSIDFMAPLKPAENTGAISNFVLWQQMRPAYAFERFGDGGMAIYDGLRRGQATLAFNTKKIQAFAEKAYTTAEVKAWEKEVKTIRIGPGKTVTMRVSQIMSLYELNKREQAVGHILGEGIRVATFKNGKQKISDVGQTLTPGELNMILRELTPRQKEVADNLQQFMEKQGGEWGNYVTVARFGEKQFGEENYFPINSDGRHLSVDADEKPGASALYALLNMSFTKQTQEKAKNRIVIYSIFDVFSNHMASMAQYNAFALPVVDALKWFNYQRVNIDEDGTKTILGSVREQMDRAFGVPEENRPGSGRRGYAQNFVINIIKALNGTEAQGTAYDSWGLQTLHNYNRAQVAYNFRVVVQQPLAITRAAQLLDYASIIKGMKLQPAAIQKNIQEMQQYSGIAAWKSLGFYDVNISRGLTSVIKHDDNWMDKVTDVGMWGAEKADTMTWAAIWSACKEEVTRKQKLTPKSEGFYEAVTKLFEDVIYKTQVVDSVLTKNEFMRDKGFWARAVGSFMSEPTTTASMLVDAYDKYHMDLQRGMNRQQAWKKNSKMIVRTAYVYGIGAAILAAVQAVADAFRDDDDYQKWYEKWLEAFGGNLVDELIPFNKLPLLSDFYDVAKELLSIFGVDTYGNPPQSVFMQWYDSLIKGVEIIYGKITGDEEKYTWYGGAYKLLQAASGMTGLPMGAATREIVTAWNSIVGAMAPSLKVKTYDPGEKNEIKYAYQDGYLTAEEATDQLLQQGLVDTEDEAYFTVHGWEAGDGYSRYDAIYDAVRNGGDINEAMRELTSHGYTEKDVLIQVKSKIGTWYKGGEITKQQATNMLTKYFDMDSEEITNTVNKWSCVVVTGIEYDAIKQEYIEGNITTQRAIEMRMRYGGQTREDARNAVGEWTFEAEHPELDGRITYTQYKRWETDGKPNGVSLNTFTNVADFRNDGTSGSVKSQDEVAEYINSLNISTAQKDALWCCFWKESTLKNAPWH